MSVSTMPDIEYRHVADVVFSGYQCRCDHSRTPVLYHLDLDCSEPASVVFMPAVLPSASTSNVLDRSHCHAKLSSHVGKANSGSRLAGQNVSHLFLSQLPRTARSSDAAILALCYPLQVVWSVVGRITVDVMAHMLRAWGISVDSLSDKPVGRKSQRPVSPGSSLSRAFLSLEKHFAVFSDFQCESFNLHSLNISHRRIGQC